MYGKRHSDEWKNSMSERMKGTNHPQFGLEKSSTTKQKISETLSGRKQTSTTVEKSRLGHCMKWQFENLQTGEIFMVSDRAKFCSENNLKMTSAYKSYKTAVPLYGIWKISKIDESSRDK